METKDTLSSCSNSEEQQMQQIQDKAKESCMVSFRQLHSHLKLLSNNDLQGTRTESGFKRAFATLFGQDIETFTGTMFLNVDQLEKQLDKEEFQEIGSMAAFKVLETQFQMFIKSRIYLDDEFVVMTRNYFLQYTQLAIPEFRDTLIQHMESVKKSIDERAKHKQEYNSWVNERQMQTTEDKVDSSKALDASLVDTESSGTALKEQDTSSRSGNDARLSDEADNRPHILMKTNWLSSELGIHDHINELSSSKLVPKVVPPTDKTATSRQELELLFHHHITMLRSYALSWKPCQGDSLNLPDHRKPSALSGAVITKPSAPLGVLVQRGDDVVEMATMVVMLSSGVGKMMTKVIWWSEDDVWRGGVEREKVVCRLLAGVGMAGKYGREIERERDGG
ncbi:hypothetical protein Tco_0712943 [Tanacetum coccineum]